MPLYRVITKLNNVPHFYIGTSEAYNNLETIDSKGMYFLYDQGVVMVKDKNFMQSVNLYSNENPKPPVGADSRLYVNIDNFEGYIYQGKWIKVFDLLNTEHTTLENATSRKKVTGKDVETIMDYYMGELTKRAVNSIEWDEENKILTYKTSSIKMPNNITGIATQLAFDVNTYTLSILDSDNNILGSEEITDLHVISGKYDQDEKALVLTMKNGSKVKIMAGAMTDLFTGSVTNSMDTKVSKGEDDTNQVSMNVLISSAYRNGLVLQEDGLHFKKTDWMYNDKDKSGYIYTVLDDHIVLEDRWKLSDLATEAEVQTMIDDILNFYEDKKSEYLLRSNVLVESFDDIPSTEKVPSLELINKTFGIKRL